VFRCGWNEWLLKRHNYAIQLRRNAKTKFLTSKRSEFDPFVIAGGADPLANIPSYYGFLLLYRRCGSGLKKLALHGTIEEAGYPPSQEISCMSTSPYANISKVLIIQLLRINCLVHVSFVTMPDTYTRRSTL
jgi:hypothetical protein